MIYRLWKEAGGVITTSAALEHGKSGLRGLLVSVAASPNSEFYCNTIDPGEVVDANIPSQRPQLRPRDLNALLHDK